MPRLSILIPCMQDASDFEDTLASVLQNRPKNCEILVVQPRPYEDPYSLSGEVRFLETASHLSTIELINIGVQQSKSEIIHLLSCDVRVTDRWTEPVLSHFADRQVASVTPRVVKATSPDETVTVGVSYGFGGQRRDHPNWPASPRISATPILGPSLCAGFYRRQAILDAGGFCVEAGASLADIDLAITLWKQGHQTVHASDSRILTSQPSNSKRSLSFQSGVEAERLFWRNLSNFEASLPTMLAWHGWTILSHLMTHCYRPSILCHAWGRLRAASVGTADDACRPQRQPVPRQVTFEPPRGNQRLVFPPPPAENGQESESSDRRQKWRSAA